MQNCSGNNSKNTITKLDYDLDRDIFDFSCEKKVEDDAGTRRHVKQIRLRRVFRFCCRFNWADHQIKQVALNFVCMLSTAFFNGQQHLLGLRPE